MARSILVPSIMLVLLGCSEGPAEPRVTQASKLTGPSLAAATFTSSEVIPTSLVAFVPCANGGTGELVELSGNLHALEHITTSETGNVTVRSHFQPQGVSGVGLTSGTKYQATGVTQETFTTGGPFPFVDTFVNNFRIIGAGAGNNLTIHQTLHITVNANGVVTTTEDHGEIRCT
jgi:hypothetical protein